MKCPEDRACLVFVDRSRNTSSSCINLVFQGARFGFVFLSKDFSNESIYIKEMPQRAAVFFALWTKHVNAHATAYADITRVHKDTAETTRATDIRKAFRTKVEADFLFDEDAKNWLKDIRVSLPGHHSQRDRAAENIAPIVNAYVQAFYGQFVSGKGPFDLLIDEVETLLERQRLFAIGATIPEFSPFLFQNGGRNGARQRAFVIGGSSRDRLRAPKAALATATKAAVDNVKGGPVAKNMLIDVLDYGAVKRRGLLQSNIASMLTSAIDAMVEAFWDGDDRLKNKQIDAATGLRAAEYFLWQNPLRQIEISTLFLNVGLITKTGRAYFKHVATAEPRSAPGGRIHDFANVDTSALHLHSPVHLDQLANMQSAFRFPDASSAATDLELNAASLHWAGETPAARKTAADAAMEHFRKRGGDITMAWGLFEGSAKTYSAVSKMRITLDPAHNARLDATLKTLQIPDKPEDIPPSMGAKGLALFNFLAAIYDFHKSVEKAENKGLTNWGAPEVIDLAKSSSAVVSSGVSLAEAIGGTNATARAIAPTAMRCFGVVGLVFVAIDICFTLRGIMKSDNIEKQAALLLQASGQTLTAISIMMGTLRAVPHPGSFVVATLGQIIAFLGGWFFELADAGEMADLLDRSYFSKKSGLTRRKEMMDVFVQELVIQTNPTVMRNNATNLVGMHELYFEFFRVVPDSFDTSDRTETGFIANNAKRMHDDWRRQIAVIFGKAGGFVFEKTDGGSLNAVLQSNRKTISIGDVDKDKARLPKGTTLEFFDASHDRSVNSGVLGIAPNWFNRIPLGRSNHVGSLEWKQAESDLIDTKDGANVDTAKGLVPPACLEAILTLPTRAWVTPFGDTGPKMQIIARVWDV